MAAILGTVLVLVPLLIAPHLLFYFDLTPKLAVLLLGTAVLLPWAVARGRLAALAGSRTGRWFAILLTLQMLSLALSTALSKNPALSLGGSNWRRLGMIADSAILAFALCAAAYVATHPGWKRSCCRLVAASGAAIASYGILQYLGWDPWLPPAAYHVGEGIWTIVRPPGTLGYASYLASYLLVVVFAGLAVAQAGGADDRHLSSALFWKALGWSAAALASVAIVLSGTRAAMLGLAAGGLLLVFWMRPRLRMAPLALGIAAAVAAAGLFYYSSLGAQLRGRTRWFVEDAMGGARPLLWRDSLRMAGARWATGYGPETFSGEFPRFQSTALARAYPDFYHESPHNIFLDALAAQGMPGLMLLAALCGLGLYGVRQARKTEPALGAAFVALLISLQFTGFVAATALYFYLLLALLLNFGDRLRNPQRGFRSLSPKLAGALALAAVWVWFGVRLVAADRALEVARANIEAGRIEEAARAFQRSLAWRPAGTGSDLWYSRSMLMAAQRAASPRLRLAAWQQAFEAARRATATAEDPHNAWYSLAMFYAARNELPGTAASLRSAIAVAPSWFKPHWMLARALQRAGRLEEAEREALVAAKLDGGKNPEVAATLDEIRESRSKRLVN